MGELGALPEPVVDDDDKRKVRSFDIPPGFDVVDFDGGTQGSALRGEELSMSYERMSCLSYYMSCSNSLARLEFAVTH